MNLFETLGIAWRVFTSALATVAIFYFAWCGISQAWRQRQRGDVEEKLDLRRASEGRFLMDRAARQA